MAGTKTPKTPKVPTEPVRPLYEIAGELLPMLRALPKTNMAKWAGIPYSEPMLHMTSTADEFGADSGRSIVAYALGNLQSWRGDDARRIKAELKAHLAGAPVRQN